MTGRFEVLEPGKIEMELSVTMKLEEWCMLKKLIDCSMWPGSEFIRQINDMIIQAEKHFCLTAKKQG